MKWFKHDSDAKNDVRCKLLISKFGMEGYGIYWGILEFIADNTIDEKKNSDTWGVLPEIFSVEFFAGEFKIESEKMQNILDYMSQIGLIDQENWSQNRVANFKILTRADEYTEKLKKKIEGTPDNVPTKSGQNPDNVPSKNKNRTRTETEQKKNRTESEQKKIFKDSPIPPREMPDSEVDSLLEKIAGRVEGMPLEKITPVEWKRFLKKYALDQIGPAIDSAIAHCKEKNFVPDKPQGWFKWWLDNPNIREPSEPTPPYFNPYPDPRKNNDYEEQNERTYTTAEN